ncbi:hypothetical protein DVH24_034476 [Malus domestica]|uniref:Uncharacterized protein n=1 Tax=Malus domestica TaxID=3750 RepID=A0A498IWK5_MALDO|nr:hypothetical protein DVH24_034476 [Malus domestica]
MEIQVRVEAKIFTRRHVDFWIKEDKNTLDAYRDSYARAAGNHLLTKSKMAKEGSHSHQKPRSSLLLKFSKALKHFFLKILTLASEVLRPKPPPFIVGA